jgi:hypothetical protein
LSATAPGRDSQMLASSGRIERYRICGTNEMR